jgi:nitrogen regulatory protein PII
MRVGRNARPACRSNFNDPEFEMDYKRIIAIVPTESLQVIEERLKQLHVGGVTLSQVKGYGEYKNLFARDWMTEHAKIELFVEAPKVDGIIDALAQIAHGAPPGAGIAAVIPVERFVHLRSASETSSI